jgi:hypothetical protein
VHILWCDVFYDYNVDDILNVNDKLLNIVEEYNVVKSTKISHY